MTGLRKGRFEKAWTPGTAGLVNARSCSFCIFDHVVIPVMTSITMRNLSGGCFLPGFILRLCLVCAGVAEALMPERG